MRRAGKPDNVRADLGQENFDGAQPHAGDPIESLKLVLKRAQPLGDLLGIRLRAHMGVGHEEMAFRRDHQGERGEIGRRGLLPLSKTLPMKLMAFVFRRPWLYSFAGRVGRRSITKSCPFGLRVMASSMAS